MKYRDEHIKSGIVCPFCRSELGIVGDSIEIDGNTARQEAFCVECGGAWLDIYSLVGTAFVCETDAEEGRKKNVEPRKECPAPEHPDPGR